MAAKIFIIGLPRSGTTSLCYALLEQGIATAHTAYTNTTFANATALADTPIFNDYQTLDNHYPDAKFIYLQRELHAWIPSIRQLLERMYTNLTRSDGGFNSHIKRCFLNVFPDLSGANINDDGYLAQCYENHFNTAKDYFKQRQADFLVIDISHAASYQQMCKFLMISSSEGQFVKMNAGGKVTAWNDIKHPLKIASTRNGKIDKSLNYAQKIL
ncbi:sulfotransferase [Pseudoalteromonas mariniglutinosa]|uniref:sulfotransferase n=1 Tax=Pseudoalteromonas mariniglutinosa TaxID=206042 RepID=UPI0038508739